MFVDIGCDTKTKDLWATTLTWETETVHKLWSYQYIGLNKKVKTYNFFLFEKKDDPLFVKCMNCLYTRMLCVKVGWNWPGFAGEDFWKSTMSRKTWLFTWTNLNPLYPSKLSAKFGWNWPICPVEEDFFQFISAFSRCLYYLPMIVALQINEIEFL